MIKSLPQELRLIVSIFVIPVISVKTLGRGYMNVMGPTSIILPNTILPLINSYRNYSITTHRALPNTSQILPQKVIVKFN